MKKKLTQKRVDFAANPEDLRVLMLAQLGLHTKAQVQRRVIMGRHKGIRKDYRDGTSHMAGYVIDHCARKAQNISIAWLEDTTINTNT